jgi:hypothetical protein
LFASKEKHVGKKHYLFLYKDFDRSKKLSQFTFNGQNFFFWLTPWEGPSSRSLMARIFWVREIWIRNVTDGDLQAVTSLSRLCCINVCHFFLLFSISSVRSETNDF